MIRTYVHYGSERYIIGHVTAESVKKQVLDILASGSPGWLAVNFGEGQEQQAELLIVPHVPFAVYDVDDSDDEVYGEE